MMWGSRLLIWLITLQGVKGNQGFSSSSSEWNPSASAPPNPCLSVRSESSWTSRWSGIVAEQMWLQAAMEQPLVLRCHVCLMSNEQREGRRLIQSWWSRDGERLHRVPSHRRMLEQRLSLSQHLLSLHLARVHEMDLGRYTCHALLTSSEEMHTDIVVSAVPYPSTLAPALQKSPTSFELSWRTQSATPIIHFLLEFRAVDHDADLVWLQIVVPGAGGAGAGDGGADPGPASSWVAQHYLLRGLEWGVAYEARVRSRNAFGLSGQSNVITFRTDEAEQSDQMKRGAQQNELEQQSLSQRDKEQPQIEEVETMDTNEKERQEERQKAEQKASLNTANRQSTLNGRLCIDFILFITLSLTFFLDF